MKKRFIVNPGKFTLLLGLFLSILFLFVDKVILFFWFIVAFVIGTLMVLATRYILKKYIKGPPPGATFETDLATMFELAKPNPESLMTDLGSGDGPIVMYFAQHGIKAHGYEINPILALVSKLDIKRRGLEHKAKIYTKNFWKVNLSDYDVVTIYGISYIMADLEKKLRTELKPGTRVVSNYFKFPTWEPKKTVGELYLYCQE